MFVCLECGETFKEMVDFHFHLVYNELYDEQTVKRLTSIGVFTEEETKNLLHYINMEFMK